MRIRRPTVPPSIPPTPRWDEREMVRGLKAGSEDALHAIVHRYWSDLTNYALQFLKTRDEAEDIVQEALIRLWLRRKTWRQTETLRPVLYRITRNLALNERRRRMNFRRWARTLRRSERDARPTPHRAMKQADLRAIVEEAVAALPERRREVFILVRTHQMTYRETAEVLGIAPQTVANHMTRAMEDLRRALAPHLEAHAPEEIPFPRIGAS